MFHVFIALHNYSLSLMLGMVCTFRFIIITYALISNVDTNELKNNNYSVLNFFSALMVIQLILELRANSRLEVSTNTGKGNNFTVGYVA